MAILPMDMDTRRRMAILHTERIRHDTLIRVSAGPPNEVSYTGSAPKAMLVSNSDIALLVYSRLDNGSLSNLSLVSRAHNIILAKLHCSSHFWWSRLHQLGASVPIERASECRDIYHLVMPHPLVSPTVHAYQDEHNELLQCELAAKTLLELAPLQMSGAADITLNQAFRVGSREVLALFVSNEDWFASRSTADEDCARYTKRYIAVIRAILDKSRCPSIDMNDWVVYYACENGHTEVVRLFLEDGQLDPGAYNNQGLIEAVKCGAHDLVQLLIADPRVDRHAQCGQALKEAWDRQHDMKMVDILLSRG